MACPGVVHRVAHVRNDSAAAAQRSLLSFFVSDRRRASSAPPTLAMPWCSPISSYRALSIAGNQNMIFLESPKTSSADTGLLARWCNRLSGGLPAVCGMNLAACL